MTQRRQQKHQQKQKQQQQKHQQKHQQGLAPRHFTTLRDPIRNRPAQKSYRHDLLERITAAISGEESIDLDRYTLNLIVDEYAAKNSTFMINDVQELYPPADRNDFVVLKNKDWETQYKAQYFHQGFISPVLLSIVSRLSPHHPQYAKKFLYGLNFPCQTMVYYTMKLIRLCQDRKIALFVGKNQVINATAIQGCFPITGKGQITIFNPITFRPATPPHRKDGKFKQRFQFIPDSMDCTPHHWIELACITPTGKERTIIFDPSNKQFMTDLENFLIPKRTCVVPTPLVEMKYSRYGERLPQARYQQLAQRQQQVRGQQLMRQHLLADKLSTF